MREKRSLLTSEDSMEIEGNSLINNLDSIGDRVWQDGDLGNRRIVLLRYPVRKTCQL